MNEIDKIKIFHWLRFAKEDLQMANYLMDAEFPIYRGVCFDCQQSAEKNLKGYLIFFNQEIIKTHDLSFLIDSITPFDGSMENFRNKSKLLLNYSVKQRYPDDFEDLTKEHAVNAIAIATEIEKYITAKIVL